MEAEKIVICPNCGENNSENFRYCGMCGTSLEPRRPAGAPRTVSAETQRTLQREAAVDDGARTRAVSSTTSAVHEPPTNSGPSFLGLNQPYAESPRDTGRPGSTTGESFSNLDSFFEPEESGVSVRGIILMLLLLAALGGGGWWAYSHYNGPNSATTAAKPTAAQPESANPPSVNPPAQEPAPSPSANNANSSPETTPSSSTALSPSTPAPAETAKSTPPPSVEAKPERNPPPPKPAERPHRNEKTARATKPGPRPSPVAAVSSDKGDAEFKRGEAYLYGRGVSKNCNEAIRNLKDASAKQNAKARSTFGTMYATGHCVPRDLPTSYSWFAQALHADPNNQILEKDLTAVWNQMTPPERQMAARSKP